MFSRLHKSQQISASFKRARNLSCRIENVQNCSTEFQFFFSQKSFQIDKTCPTRGIRVKLWTYPFKALATLASQAPFLPELTTPSYNAPRQRRPNQVSPKPPNGEMAESSLPMSSWPLSYGRVPRPLRTLCITVGVTVFLYFTTVPQYYLTEHWKKSQPTNGNYPRWFKRTPKCSKEPKGKQ